LKNAFQGELALGAEQGTAQSSLPLMTIRLPSRGWQTGRRIITTEDSNYSGTQTKTKGATAILLRNVHISKAQGNHSSINGPPYAWG